MKKKENSVERFFPVGYDLMCCDGFVDKDGKEIALSLHDKIVYSYLKARIGYFVNERKGDYFDTQEKIAYSLSFAVNTVRKSIKKFFDAGVLQGYKAKWNNYENWRYVSIEDLKTYRKNDINKEKRESAEKTPANKTAGDTYVDWLDNFDGIDPPF